MAAPTLSTNLMCSETQLGLPQPFGLEIDEVSSRPMDLILAILKDALAGLNLGYLKACAPNDYSSKNQ